jgi:hypothetical protein
VTGSSSAKRGKRCNGDVDMPATVSISGRGPGRIISTDGSRVVLEAGTAAPPGASLTCEAEGAIPPFKIKVSACKRSAEGTFRIEGRFVDLTREQRAALESMTQGSS